MTVLTTLQIVNGQNTLYEDQALICVTNTNEQSENMGDLTCKVIQHLDLLTEKQQDKLNDEFGENYDNDTFDIGDW